MIEAIIPLIKLCIIFIFSWVILKLLLEKNVEWIKSVRSLVTILVVYTFCKLTEIGKIDTKDFIIIVQAVVNFYFLVKQRISEGQIGEGK